MLTVACVWVKGPVPYTVDYVTRLERMVRRYLQRDFHFVCLTDQPHLVPDCATPIVVPTLTNMPWGSEGYWSKIHLFDPTIGLSGRVLFLDLDVLVVAPLDPIVDFPALMALTTDAFIVERAHLDRDREGRRLIRRYNSSVIAWNAGPAWKDLYTAWTPAVARRLSTDQDWIAERHPEAAGMPLEWFPRISRVQPPWPDEAKVVLVKKPKNHDAIKRWPWFDAMWGGWAA